LKGIKTPLCDNCTNKLYAVNIRREKIGYICPDCDYVFIKKPTKILETLRKKIIELKEENPTFKQKIYSVCGVCKLSKFVKCRYNPTKPYKGHGFGETTWVCWCENPKHKEEPGWTQDHDKIWIVPYYQKSKTELEYID